MTDTDKKILRYLGLVDRKLYIVLHSGVDWKPEYGPEMQQIDQEIVQLRDELGLENEKDLPSGNSARSGIEIEHIEIF